MQPVRKRREIEPKVIKGGFIMNKVFAVILCMLFVSVGLDVSAAEKDRQGSKDHPLLSRMPDFHISDYKDIEFDSYKFIVEQNKKSVPVNVEGHKYYIRYDLNSGAAKPGNLKIVRNIENALKNIGGKILVDVASQWGVFRSSTIMVQKGNKETWINVKAAETSYELTIVEKETMKQEVVADAAAMGNDIDATGHVSIYGIYFDTGKSEIKPESDAAIAEIAKLLKNNDALKVYVVGHTDNVGSFDANMKLSRDRADAVAKALISNFGISSSRLKAYGVSSLNPIASNKTEEGKAKNRRVELVEQ
jgi:OmpA-OmpF porin, OOP family